jgi:TPR repeat protein
MFQLYLLTSDLDWLIKSADANFPEGQDWLAVQYQEGKGFFLIPGKRDNEIERLFRAAAKAGYVPAMGNLAMFLLSKKDLSGAGRWIEAAAKLGHFGAISSYGAWTAHAPDRVGFSLDLVKAYGLIYLLAQAEPGAYSYGQRKLKKISDKMSPQQIEAGKAFAEEWKRSHPPLSRFLPKYGY